MAAHLRPAFPGDGEEVADVIARHYLDALHAVPDDPDTGQIRGQAIAALIRAAERAERTGAPARAAASYATAAELTEVSPPDIEDGQLIRGDPVGTRRASRHHRRGLCHGARAQAGRARASTCSAARTGTPPAPRLSPARCCASWGRYTGARARLIAAMEVLRPDPDTDTVRALEQLAALEVFAGSPDADRLTTEVLVLGQDLDVDPASSPSLLVSRGIYLGTVGRRPEAAAYLRESARLATQAGDNMRAGTALLNLSDAVVLTDPAAAAETALTAAWHLRRAGAREHLGWAIGNLVQALLMLGEWDAAEAGARQAIDADGLTDIEYLTCHGGLLAALRGDAGTAQDLPGGLDRHAGQRRSPRESLIGTLEAFTAAARRQQRDALRHARRVLAHADVLGISNDDLRWAWPLAARSACELNDAAARASCLPCSTPIRPGDLPPCCEPNGTWSAARLAARDGDPNAGARLRRRRHQLARA